MGTIEDNHGPVLLLHWLLQGESAWHFLEAIAVLNEKASTLQGIGVPTSEVDSLGWDEGLFPQRTRNPSL